MNIILLQPDEIRNNLAEITGRRLDHILRVIKSVPGDYLKIGIVNGPMGTGIIRSIDRNRVILEIQEEEAEPPRSEIDLILALPRPIMLKRILSQATSMGIDRFFLINAARVEKSFFKASLLDRGSYSPYLHHGLEQAIDTLVPEISLHRRFKPFVEDVLPKLSLQSTYSLLTHPSAKERLTDLISVPLQGRILIAIGPEGGWLDYEVEKFRQQGVRVFNMGPRILRVDTSITAVLAQLDLLRHFRGHPIASP